jgi:hypothetical protein
MEEGNPEGCTVQTVLDTLDRITGGRLPPPGACRSPGSHPFVLEKSSGIAGKSVLETPGLVVGDPDKPVASMGIGMTLTESMIELAGALGLDAILVHHPVADAASSGGVPLKPYLDLYGLALFELHEAFHGLHPGIAFLHGHRVLGVDHCFAGIPGNIVLRGKSLPEVRTAGDILKRLDTFMDVEREREILETEAGLRACPGMRESSLTAVPGILSGSPDSRVDQVLHIFPHTGFTASHLAQALDRYPGIDTVIASISRVPAKGDMAEVARKRGLTLIIGNSHAHEILENGLPLAWAIRHYLPGLDLVILRERVTAVPLDRFGNRAIQEYGQRMAGHLAGRPVPG